MKPILFFCFSLLVFTRATAQFTPPVVVADIGFYEYGHRIYDWDSDGDLDFIGYRALTILEWYENTGDGFLLDPVVLDTFSMNYSLLSGALFADFNSDGHTDIVISNSENLLVYLQLSDGQWGQPDSLPFDGTNARLRLTDMDNDGDMDMVSLGFGVLQWHENDGTGHFSPPIYIANQPYMLLDIVDVDADGRPDIFTANYATGSTVSLYLNPGNGLFIPKQVPTSVTGLSFYNFITADLDGDALPDLLPAWSTLFTPVWLKNTGNGTFALPQPIDSSFNQWPGGYTRWPADMDNDGDTDVIVGGVDTLMWLENLHNGLFSTHLLHTGLDYETAGIVAINDYDSDGLPDVVLTIANGGVAYLKNLGSGQFGPFETLAPEFLEIKSVQTADLDNDGNKDLLITSYVDKKLAWYPNLGAGQWGAQRIISISNINQTLALPADLDGDGDADIVSSNDASDEIGFQNELFWYENLGSGQFGPSKMVLPGVPLFAESADAVDLDADGDLDLVFQVDGTALYLAWLPNDGTGHFGFPIFIDPSSILYKFLAVADMDRDHDPDLVVRLSNGLYWYANDGAAFFDGPYLLASEEVFFSRIADIDADSLPDLVYSVDAGAGLLWARNPGNHGLLETPRPIESAPNHIFYDNYRLTDLNGDGLTDVLGFFHDFAYGWIPNLGGGVFGERIVLGWSAAGYMLHSSDDLNGDGDPEFIYYKPYATWQPAQLGYYTGLEGLPSVRGRCFLDENTNGLHDAGEPDLPGITVTLHPATPLVQTDQDGAFRFTAPPGQYVLGFQADSCWALTSDSTVFHLTLPNDTVFEFGFRHDLDFTNINTFLTSAQPICGQTVPFWLSLHNDGCHAAKARYRFEIGPRLSWGSAIPNPSVIVGDTIFWEIDSLLQPGETRNIEAQVLISPAVAGETPVVAGMVETISADDGTVLRADTFYYAVPVLCSYDPNDKLVNVSELPPNYAPDSSLLTYTIRFQNTGNFMAFNIRVRDTLDAALDWNTFEPLAASHSYFPTLDTASGVAQFDFLDIRLADSTSNEPMSHGFVAFSIRLKPGLSPGAFTRNRAGIYFDVNAPVITNWAETQVRTLVSTHPVLRMPALKISPNPTADVLTVFFPKKPDDDARVQVFDLQGRMILEKSAAGGLEVYSIDVSALPAAAYLLKIKEKDGATGQAFFVKI